ncbi:hypothetical protein D9756_011113 [Leucocoprinus leucothites]|uniref:Uncharacterized protein n=1 Tax=Leucocoprinus leucothites TaxID=201217 RepID=A0A8H5FST0_9AGAR|nr:hypothetical protein D9756_011113 [Leucoagaricus leucothites]
MTFTVRRLYPSHPPPPSPLTTPAATAPARPKRTANALRELASAPRTTVLALRQNALATAKFTRPPPP